MLMEDFNHTVDIWVSELDRYSFTQLQAKPSLNSWSLGQVYMHIISQSQYYLGQMAICTSTDEFAEEGTSPAASKLFLANALPNTLIEGPPSNAHTPQPTSKEQLMLSLLQLKEAVNNLAPLLGKTAYQGKTKHPGLQYFNARQWLQFAEMHLRHHLRQKERLDAFLGMGGE